TPAAMSASTVIDHLQPTTSSTMRVTGVGAEIFFLKPLAIFHQKVRYPPFGADFFADARRLESGRTHPKGSTSDEDYDYRDRIVIRGRASRRCNSCGRGRACAISRRLSVLGACGVDGDPGRPSSV